MNRHIHSFHLAFSGVWYAIRTQLNFKVHSLAAVLAVVLGFYFQISHVEWVALILTIVLVFVAEMINTSIESMTNLITTEHRQQAKIAKDISAGMVLTAAIGAVIVGIVIFAPKIF
jgi:diacylglycerol kinase (ATP)